MTNSQNRKSRRIFLQILRFLSLHFLRLSGAHLLGIIGSLLILGSLFFDWFHIPSLSISGGAFHGLLGRVGFLFVFLCLGNLFLVLSINSKEHLKKQSRIQFQDSTIMLLSGLIIAILALVCGNALTHWNIFASDAQSFQGPVFTCIGGILLGIAGYLLYRQERAFILSSLYVENKLKSEELDGYEKILQKKNEDKNMTLPF